MKEALGFVGIMILFTMIIMIFCYGLTVTI
jgi:hypothetical protein